MSLFVDTSVWSLALRRDQAADLPEVRRLVRALESGETVVITGLILQELLQGFSGPKDREAILQRLSVLPLLPPDRRDHIEAAQLRNLCRHRGVQIGMIDALLGQLCLRHELVMLSADDNFRHIAAHCRLMLWN